MLAGLYLIVSSLSVWGFWGVIFSNGVNDEREKMFARMLWCGGGMFFSTTIAYGIKLIIG